MIGVAILFLCIIGYALFEARNIVYGPNIILTTETTEVTERVVLIQGKAERIAELRINGRTIPVTESGAFEEPVVLTQGYNRIMVTATDKFGRTEEKVLELIYQPTTQGIDITPLDTPRPGVE